MKKTQLLELGLKPDQIKAIQHIHGEDMSKLQIKLKSSAAREHYINAISGMIPLVKRSDDLRRILDLVNHIYYLETRAKIENQEESNEKEETNDEAK